MYLAELKLWNYRKYGGTEINEEPALTVYFKHGLNVLIGENDSGKTTIIDSIKQILLTQSHEYIFIEENDFSINENNNRTEELKIEVIFRGFTDEEAANFLEWANFNENGQYELQIRLHARRKENRIFTDVMAGIDGADSQLDGNARELLRVTYLKPLRNAESELTPGRRSRFAQILKNHSLFRSEKDEEGKLKKHQLEKYIDKINELIENYFDCDQLEEDTVNQFPSCKGAKEIKDKINQKLNDFFPIGMDYEANIRIANSNLIDILHKLSLLFDDNKSGLGALNLLFIATELLLLQTESVGGLKLVLIEELEAHLHPQAQLRLIHFLQNESNIELPGQYILTTHSPTLASSIILDNLIICQNKAVFPMGKNYTKLYEGDYNFLERFLDATKANLFFARGVILVEGDAENILIPGLAEIIDRPLHKYGVSIVNVGSTAFLRYSRIFMRKKDKMEMDIPVSIITDLDVKPFGHPTQNNKKKEEINTVIKTRMKEKDDYYKYKERIKAFVSPAWTLEYVLALSGLKKYVLKAIMEAQKIGNSKYGEINENKKDEVENDADTFFTHNSDKTDEELALKIYQKYLLDKQVSKAITAQCLVKILSEEKEKVKEILLKDKEISYLREVIIHVTAPFEKDISKKETNESDNKQRN